MIKAIFFDIDGALYSHRDYRIPESAASFPPPIESYRGGDIYQASGFFGEEDAGELLPYLTSCKFATWRNGAIDIISADGGKTECFPKSKSVRRLYHYRYRCERNCKCPCPFPTDIAF